MGTENTGTNALRKARLREHITSDPITCPCNPFYQVSEEGALLVIHQIFPEQYLGEN
jgi:hypothetical protein